MDHVTFNFKKREKSRMDELYLVCLGSAAVVVIVGTVFLLMFITGSGDRDICILFGVIGGAFTLSMFFFIGRCFYLSSTREKRLENKIAMAIQNVEHRPDYSSDSSTKSSSSSSSTSSSSV